MECLNCHHRNETDAVTCSNCKALLQTIKTNEPGSFDLPLYVKVEDIEMSFMSMVTFMVKLAFAAIPAAIIVFVLMGFSYGVLTAMFHR